MATSVEQVTYNSPDGATIGQSATEKVSLYGVTPVVQRASSVQAASVVSAASFISVSTNLCLFAAEVAATLTGLGIWKGTA
jgi:hypothetical protein